MRGKWIWAAALILFASVVVLSGCAERTPREEISTPVTTTLAGPPITTPAPATPASIGETETGSCGNDLPTSDSLEGARSKLDAGATSVDVSPGGCIQYTVTSAGTTTIEELLFDKKVAVRMTHDAEGAESERDADLDGFFEWRSVLVKGTEPSDDKLTVEEYDQATKILTLSSIFT
jgi:hypothetical protein